MQSSGNRHVFCLSSQLGESGPLDECIGDYALVESLAKVKLVKSSAVFRTESGGHSLMPHCSSEMSWRPSVCSTPAVVAARRPSRMAPHNWLFHTRAPLILMAIELMAIEDFPHPVLP